MIESALTQWEEGRRRIAAERSDSVRYRQLWELAEVVVAELRRRLGQRFTLDELARAHVHADDWARAAITDAIPLEPRVGVWDLALVLDVAFDAYARGAVDYRAS
jgi:DNA-binding transcriptional regulator YdaS (Cro superfamily)